MDVRNSLSIAFLAILLAINTEYLLAINTDFYFFYKFFTKWPPADILDVRKSLSIAFLAISDRSAILDVQNSLSMASLAISDPYGY